MNHSTSYNTNAGGDDSVEGEARKDNFQEKFSSKRVGCGWVFGRSLNKPTTLKERKAKCQISIVDTLTSLMVEPSGYFLFRFNFLNEINN